MALIVHVQRAASIRQRAVVEHGHTLGRDTLADQAAEGTRSLAVEVALQAVSDRFVEQHARPSRAEHHAHLAGLRGPRRQVGQRRIHRVADIALQQRVVEVAVSEAAAPATAAGLAAHRALDGLLRDHRDVHAHEWSHIGGPGAVGAGDQHHVVFARQAGHHLLDSGVFRSRHAFDPLEQCHLLRAVQRGDRVHRRVQQAAAGHLARGVDLHAAALSSRSDRAHCLCGVHQRGLGDVV